MESYEHPHAAEVGLYFNVRDVLAYRFNRVALELQHQIRTNAEALASSIVLEQGKTLPGSYSLVLGPNMLLIRIE